MHIIKANGVLRSLAACFLLIAPSSGCVDGAPPPGPTSPPPTSTAAAAPSAIPEEIRDAIAFRNRYGLRADEAWVREVAADPEAQAAINEYGVPLTPAEFVELRGRRFDLDVFDDVQAYGRLFPEDYAGAYLNQATGGIIVSFKNRVERHRAAIANLFSRSAKVEVRQVEWSSRELDRFATQINEERAWFETIGVRFISADRSIKDDFVSVHYLGPIEAVVPIEGHFGNPTWLRAEWDGPGPWTGPRGDLEIHVTDSAGRPVPNIWCELKTENRMVGNEFFESFIRTGPAGVCEFRNWPAIVWQVRLHELVDNDHYDADPVKEFQVVLTSVGKVVDVMVPAT